MSPQSEPITVVKEKLIPAGIDEVWKYLTDGKLLSQWFAETDGLKPDAEFVFEFGDGDFFSGRVVNWDEPASLGLTWKFMGLGQTSRVDYSMEAAGESTFLTLRDHGALTPDEAVGLDEGWDDFLSRLIGRIETRQPTRYRWTETIGASAFLGNDTTIDLADFDDRWWQANFPGVRVSLESVEPNKRRFAVRDDAWGGLVTTATTSVRQMPAGIYAVVFHEGWVKLPESQQLGERRRFARLWERALRQLEQNSNQPNAAGSFAGKVALP